MLDELTEKEQTDIRVAVDNLERMNNKESAEVLEVIDLFLTVIEDKNIEIDDLKDKLENAEGYIEDWQLY